MKGLLIKDLYVAWKMCWSYLLVEIIFCLMVALGGTSPFMLLAASYLLSMVPMTILATDERVKWHIYADTLPVTRAQAVSAKYILSLILGAVSAVAILVSGFIATVNPMLAEEGHTMGEVYATLLGCPVVIALASLCMPFIFRIGFEKGRLAFMVMCMIAGGGFGFIVSTGLDLLEFIKLPSAVIIAAVLGVSAIVFAASWALSALLYKTREF